MLRYIFILFFVLAAGANVQGVLGQDKASTCENNVCEHDEDEANCPKDCKIPQRCNDVYTYHENICTQQLGWQSISVDVDGIPRKLLWKAPSTIAWIHGAIIAMHGGSGHASNFCSGPRIAKPMEAFSRLALQEGFAVFSPDSTYARVTDKHGISVGKRWDSLYQKGRKNIDLAFIKKLLDDTIPGLRPTGSHKGIFMTGISNGGFMTILAAVHFKNELTAFAPVSAGDPFRTYFDMTTHPLFERTCAPGVFRDSDTHRKINKRDACRVEDASDNAVSEGNSATIEKSIPFKQFHHTGDAGCDFSCMQKARNILVKKRFRDDGAYIVDRGRRRVANHFWQDEYNEPIINFFKKYAVLTGSAAE